MEERSTPPRRIKPLNLILLLALASAGGYFGIRAWHRAQHHETTENAQVDGSILSVRAAVSGFVTEVRFSENQAVKKGDTLAIIDSRDFQAKVMQAVAMLRNAEAQTRISRSSAEAAQLSVSASMASSSALQANIAAARARAEKAEHDLNRLEKMFADSAATQQQLDAARAEWQSAGALLEVANRQYSASGTQVSSTRSSARAQEGQVGIADALVQQRLAELQLAEIQLSNTVIVAPFDGIVSKKSIEPGQLIQYGQPVCSVVGSENLWVVANFKETQLKKIHTGEKVRIKVDAYPDLTLSGMVESIGAATGARFALLPPDNATGNFVKVTQRVPVRIRLEGEPSSRQMLAPGLSAFVDIETD